jgi:thiol-disulfide isomerase/thioredoxin
MKDKMKTTFKIITLLLFSYCAQPAIAQQTSKPLTVGEQMPDITLHSLVNYRQPELKLSDFKDKLLILDFWNVHCTSCILAMPAEMDLEKKYTRKLFILPVTSDKKAIVEQFFKHNGFLKNYTIPANTDDIMLAQLFPHQYVPHMVWLYKGKYIASTMVEEVNAANVEAILNGTAPSWQNLTNDISQFDYKKPLFAKTVNAIMRTSIPVYNTTITGHIEGLAPKAGHSIDTIAKQKRFYMINFPLVNFYAILMNSGLIYEANRRILQVRDSSKFIYDRKRFTHQEWDSQNTYSYEALVPSTMSDEQIMQKMKQDMDVFFNLKAAIEPREVRCLVLKIKKPEALKPTTYLKKSISFHSDSARTYFHGATIEDLIYTISRNDSLPPIVDETGYSHRIDLDLHEHPLTVAQWKTELASCGLELVEEKRRIDMFILTENLPSTTSINHSDKIN